MTAKLIAFPSRPRTTARTCGNLALADDAISFTPHTKPQLRVITGGGASTSADRVEARIAQCERTAEADVRWAGLRWDREAGLYFSATRAYDPDMGQWLTPDPVMPNPEDPRTFEPWTYCFNDPINYTDPDGRAGAQPAASSWDQWWNDIKSPGGGRRIVGDRISDAIIKGVTFSQRGYGTVASAVNTLDAAIVQPGIQGAKDFVTGAPQAISTIADAFSPHSINEHVIQTAIAGARSPEGAVFGGAVASYTVAAAMIPFTAAAGSAYGLWGLTGAVIIEGGASGGAAVMAERSLATGRAPTFDQFGHGVVYGSATGLAGLGIGLGLNRFFIPRQISNVGPVVGGGANLENISSSDIVRIQNAVNRTGVEVTVVGGRARGTVGPFSDWDYILQGGNASARHSIRTSLPEGFRALGEARNIEFFPGPVRTNEPYIIFRPTNE